MTSSVADMSRRTNPQAIGQHVSAVIAAGGADVATVAAAADMDTPGLLARLNGECEFTVRELARVGGFLRLSTSALLPGGTA
jgi:hypothetical protein